MMAHPSETAGSWIVHLGMSAALDNHHALQGEEEEEVIRPLFRSFRHIRLHRLAFLHIQENILHLEAEDVNESVEDDEDI